MAKEIRIEIKPRNNLVLTRMEELGIKTVTELCRRAGFARGSMNAVASIINLKSPPLKSVKGKKRLVEWKDQVLEIANILECEPEELFPEEIKHVIIAREVNVFAEVNVDQFRRLGGNIPKQLVVGTDPEKGLQVQEFEAALNKALETLTPREEKVLKYRFGLEDGQERTINEVAALFALTPERIRGIEAKALQRMRHPMRTRMIKEPAKGVVFCNRSEVQNKGLGERAFTRPFFAYVKNFCYNWR